MQVNPDKDKKLVDAQVDMLLRLNLGCGSDVRPGWVNVDNILQDGVDLEFDLTAVASIPLPFPDNSVGKILLSHVLERIQNPLSLLEELYRVAIHGCELVIRLPHGANDEAWISPTHLRPYFPRSFSYFGQSKYHLFDCSYTADWDCKAVLLATGLVRETADAKRITQLINSTRNLVSEMAAVLTCVKPSLPRSEGPVSNPVVHYVYKIPESFDEVTNLVKKK